MIVSNYSVDTTIKQLETIISSSVEDFGELLVQDAKAKAPVRTGRLRDSIQYEVDGYQIQVGSSVPYAGYVEAKKHFLEQTSEKDKMKFAEIITSKIKE